MDFIFICFCFCFCFWRRLGIVLSGVEVGLTSHFVKLVFSIYAFTFCEKEREEEELSRLYGGGEGGGVDMAICV